MQIFSGRLKGRHLQFEFDQQPRPTMGKVREALFNIVRDPLQGASFLDCFAGTGAVGFEALSRGAKRVVFIEQDGKLIGALSANARRLEVHEEVRIAGGPCALMLKRLTREPPERFDLVYIDPPYHRGIAEEALTMLMDLGLLNPGWIAVIERSQKEAGKLDAPLLARGAECYRERRYSSTVLEFWRQGAPAVGAEAPAPPEAP
ncbi:MAG: 16S rRNA (guanine(966)-N(2))-methyltransferase RsmD [Spirochaetes bacterium]|nr:16S rRNA (guanine(966)-N(2))-methyltransferase RsmD [Spirochaetota bacterium]